MNRKYIISIALILIFGIFIVVKSNNQVSNKDYKNTSYVIEGQSIALTNGLSEIELAPESASKIVTRYFGNEIKHDLNDDGHEDVVFILTQESGGSGRFFYAVSALSTPNGYVGSEGYLLGDRIMPQSINIDEGKTTQGTNRKNVIVVNFATRALGESMATEPSVSKSVWIKLDPATMKFGEVVQNFEGESR